MQQVTLEQRLCHGNHLWHILMITVQFGYLIQMERIIEWITIANTFSPTLVWSSRYVNHWNAKQVYVLGPRQGASAMDVFGLQHLHIASRRQHRCSGRRCVATSRNGEGQQLHVHSQISGWHHWWCWARSRHWNAWHQGNHFASDSNPRCDHARSAVDDRTAR